MNIDWSKAPEGATHFLPEQPARGWIACFYKNIDGIWYARNTRDCDWYPDNDYVEIFEPLLIDRPKQWSGPQDGLPPAGTVCELAKKHKECTWQKVVIAYMGSEFFVVTCPERGYEEAGEHRHGYQFRPILTPEQIAADERQQAIDDLVKVTCINHGEAARIYDAGYRKQATP